MFNDRYERLSWNPGADPSPWDLHFASGAVITTAAAARKGGVYGCTLDGDLAGAKNAYTEHDRADSEFWTRYWLNIRTLTDANTQRRIISNFQDATPQGILLFAVYNDGGTHKFSLGHRLDGAGMTHTVTTFEPAVETWYQIEEGVKLSTALGADDGYIKVFVDGVDITPAGLDTLDNDTWTMRAYRRNIQVGDGQQMTYWTDDLLIHTSRIFPSWGSKRRDGHHRRF